MQPSGSARSRGGRAADVWEFRGDAGHVLVGLAIAVANIDEVIRLIRTSPDTATARAALMARDWPARDMAPLIELIADLDTIEVKSEPEALLLEGKLIKQWRPRYNTDFTDDKRFLLVREGGALRIAQEEATHFTLRHGAIPVAGHDRIGRGAAGDGRPERPD